MNRSRVAAVLRGAVLCTIVVIGTAACGSDDKASEFTGRWDGPGGVELTLRSDGEASGNDGCNAFGATWKATSDTEGTFEPGRSTLVACEDAGWSDPAQLALVDGQLLVKDSSGTTLSTLEPADD